MNIAKHVILNIASLVGGVFGGVLVGFAWLYSTLITTGSLELCCWDKMIISNQNVLFFANLMMIGGFGGYLSTKVKRLDLKLAILLITYTLVFLVGYITQYSQPFRF